MINCGVNHLTHSATQSLKLIDPENQNAAVLEERGRIAGEIHDSLAPTFTGIRMQLEAALMSKKNAKAKYWKHVKMALELARFGLEEASSSVLTLRPTALDHGDLSATLRQLAQRTQIKGAVRCDFSESGHARELPLKLKHELLRIVQEAISNALKHAKPKSIHITLVYHPNNIEITVYDNGTGFDPQNSECNRGFGLNGMEERTRKLNGKFCLQSGKERGTRIKVMLPIGNNHE